MNEFLATAVFALVNVVAVVSAILVVSRRNPIYAALFLVIVFGTISANFFFLGAEFLGFMQLLVYAGAIMVLYIFVIMLINPRAEALPNEGSTADRYIALGVSILVYTMLFTTIQNSDLVGIKERIPAAEPIRAEYQAQLDEISSLSIAQLLETGLTETAEERGMSESDRLEQLRARAETKAYESYRGDIAALTILFSDLERARDPGKNPDGTPVIPEPGSPEAIWAEHGSTKAFGMKLFTEHVLVFELTSVLILIAIVGAVHLSLRPRRKRGDAAAVAAAGTGATSGGTTAHV